MQFKTATPQASQAARYKALAAKAWGKADRADFKRLEAWVRDKAAGRAGALASVR